MLETYGPTALYCVLRLLTCIPPVVASITRNAPDENLRFGSGLVVFALALGLVVATAYTVLLRSFMTGGKRRCQESQVSAGGARHRKH